MSTWTIVAAAVAIVLILLAGVAKRALDRREREEAADGNDGPWPFAAVAVMSPPEQVVFHRLVAALPGHLVLAQVQVSQVLRVTATNPSVATSWRNRVSQLSFDFVVCRKDAFPVLAVEIDDSSHERTGRRETDAKKDRACRDAGLAMVRWRTNSLPDAEAARRAVTTAEASAGRGV